MRRVVYFLWLACMAVCARSSLATGVRVKDIATVAGVRDNQLVGYGLVGGLAGGGDKNPPETLQTLGNLLQRFGLTIPATTLSAKNIAIVMVTADIPAFKRAGTRLDVTVASIGDANTLQGGILLQTPLLGADGKVYAVAQGALTLGGISAGSGGEGGATVQKNHPTVGQIADGALVEREIPAEIISDHHLELILREPDFTTAARLADSVNERFTNTAEAVDSTTVRVRVPDNYAAVPVSFISELELLDVDTDIPARIVINERTGTIVATSHIRISACAVSHGNLTISIASTQNVSQPGAFSRTGTTQVTKQTSTQVHEDKGTMFTLPDLPTVEQVAAALNSLGVSPRDMMSMFQAMKEAGALQAELIIR